MTARDGDVAARVAAMGAQLVALSRWIDSNYLAWAYGGQDYAEERWDNEHWLTVADEFLREPFMRRLVAERDEAVAAVGRVRTEADQLDAEAEHCDVRASSYPPSGPWALEHNRIAVRAAVSRRAATRIRRALGGVS